MLDVDNRAVLPFKKRVKVLVTSADVIHSWALPSIGIKVDAIPGKLNLVEFNAIRPGVFYGQCSELCGALHSGIPIVVEVIPYYYFLLWLDTVRCCHIKKNTFVDADVRKFLQGKFKKAYAAGGRFMVSVEKFIIMCFWDLKKPGESFDCTISQIV